MQAKTLSRSRRLRWPRLIVGVATSASLLLGAVTLWLLRDPTSRLLDHRPGLAEVVEGPEEQSPGIVSRVFQLRDSSGFTVPLLVRTPTADSERDPAPGLGANACGRRALFLIMGGYRTGEQAAMLVDDIRGAVVASVGYPYDGPVDIEGLSVLWHVPRIRRALLDTPSAVGLALDHLLSLPEVDSARVELAGVSFGAFLAPAAAALDDRVTRLWLVHGSGRPRRVLERGLEGHVPYRAPRALVAAVANLLFYGHALAPELWVPRVAPRPVVMINALDDERLPREAVDALYASARSPKEQIWLSGQHVHPSRGDSIQQLVDTMLSRAAEDSRSAPVGAGSGRPDTCEP